MKSVKEFETKIKEYNMRLNNFATRSELNDKIKEVWNNFDRCCNIDHIVQFRSEMESRMVQCESLVGDFKLDTIKNQ